MIYPVAATQPAACGRIRPLSEMNDVCVFAEMPTRARASLGNAPAKPRAAHAAVPIADAPTGDPGAACRPIALVTIDPLATCYAGNCRTLRISAGAEPGCLCKYVFSATTWL